MRMATVPALVCRQSSDVSLETFGYMQTRFAVNRTMAAAASLCTLADQMLLVRVRGVRQTEAAD